MKASATVSTAAVAGMVTKMSERAPHPDEQARELHKLADEWLYEQAKSMRFSSDFTPQQVPSLAALLARVRQQALAEACDSIQKAIDVWKTWETDDGYEVTSGLKVGDKIVTSGNFLLDSESRVQAGLEEGK